MLNILYDSKGQPESVEYDGQTYELDAQTKALLPVDKFDTFHTRQTSINSTVEDIKDSYKKEKLEDTSSVIVSIEATHAGYYNNNGWKYLASGMKDMVGAWTAEGGRPYIVNHDMTTEPRGRVVGARFVQTQPEMGYQLLDTRIGHKQEIEMVIDGRALHVSVGSKPVDTVECNVCQRDLHKHGKSPVRYSLQEWPEDSWLEDSAPGVLGRVLELSNEDFWDIQESKDGEITALCRHMRTIDAPVKDGRIRELGWDLHAVKPTEVSRVNEPADVNEETGEYAHIRGIKDSLEDMSDSALQRILDSETADHPDGGIPRHNIASEKDLWRPSTPQKAMAFADSTGFKRMFDTALWNTVHNTHGSKTMEDQVKIYWENGGRFVDRGLSTSETKPPTLKDQLNKPPKEFGAWLRAADFSREDKAMIDRLYTRQYVKRLN